MADALLELRSVHGWYGPAHVLQGIDLHVMPGEIVALVGRNGAGKTTSICAAMGLLPRSAGSIRFDGVEMIGKPAHARFAAGLGYVPEERRIVAGLTVRENLRLGMLAVRAGAAAERRAIDEAAARFPRLAERFGQQAATMSGGEQQMLAIARALLSRPKMILLDEPSEGIMPALVDEMAQLFVDLRADGMTLLLVEQNVELALEISDRAYVLDQGMIVHEGTSADFLADPEIRERYCSV